MAQATGGSYLFRATGSVLGISLSSAILQGALRRELPLVLTGPGSSETVQRILVDIAAIKELEPALRDVVVGAYERSMRVVFAATTVMGLVAVNFSLDSGEQLVDLGLICAFHSC